VAITDEQAPKVQAWLDSPEKKDHVPYSVVSDPDRSAMMQMLNGTFRNFNPRFFIVKDGIVQWFGHPKEAAEPLAKLAAGTWDPASVRAAIDLDGVAALKEQNIPKLAALARAGYAILSPIPSCGLMFKQELPLMFPDDEDVKAVQKAMFDPFEYLVARHKDGLLETDFKEGLGNVSYHIACHLRVQNVGQKTRELLEMIPQTAVHTVERCSGHAGTWGVKKEYHETAMKIGRPVFRQMGEHPKGELNWVASDCQLAGHHIAQGMKGKADDKLAHPITLLRMAYGLAD